MIGDLIFHHEDHLTGSNVDTDSSGNVVQLLDYFPYGGTRVDEHSNDYQNDYKFTGKERDEETNLDYYESRYYNSDIARFISVDPWEGDMNDPQSFNKYSYVRNNPVKYVDPSGNIPILIAVGVIGVGLFTVDQVGDNAAPASTVSSLVGNMINEGVNPFSKINKAGKILKSVKNINPKGRNANKISPNPKATGDHTSIKYSKEGEITGYKSYEVNPKNPSGFQETKKVNLDPNTKPHKNSITKEHIGTPNVRENGTPGGIRSARGSEIPKNSASNTSARSANGDAGSTSNSRRNNNNNSGG